MDPTDLDDRDKFSELFYHVWLAASDHRQEMLERLEILIKTKRADVNDKTLVG